MREGSTFHMLQQDMCQNHDCQVALVIMTI